MRLGCGVDGKEIGGKEKRRQRYEIDIAYRLLLRGGIVQSVQYNCDNFLISCSSHLNSNNLPFIHKSSLFWLQKRHLVAKQRETGRKIVADFAYHYLSHFKGFLACRKMLWHGADSFIPLRRNSCYWFLSCLNLWTLGPMASTTTPYTTDNDY
jgi:hypothetical protein